MWRLDALHRYRGLRYCNFIFFSLFQTNFLHPWDNTGVSGPQNHDRTISCEKIKNILMKQAPGSIAKLSVGSDTVNVAENFRHLVSYAR